MDVTAQHLDFEEKRLGKPFAVKNVDEVGTFEGHGAVFDDLHPTSAWQLPMDWKDRILPGAFKATLAEHKKAGTKPSMLFMHRRGAIAGAWHELIEDDSGLQLKGQVAMGARADSGASLYELLKMSGISGLSIGFRARKFTLDEKTKVRDILDAELGEVSLVDIPGINRARVTDVKSGARSIEHFERALRDAGLSRREAKAVLAVGFSALRDAGSDDDEGLRDAGRAVDDEVLASLKRLARAIHP
jgi:uncharacterized protein